VAKTMFFCHFILNSIVNSVAGLEPKPHDFRGSRTRVLKLCGSGSAITASAPPPASYSTNKIFLNGTNGESLSPYYANF
jgi:hypothetical protein